MGDLRVSGVESPAELRAFYLSVLDDLDTLDTMIREGMIDDGTMHIGAEQELCIVDEDCRPSKKGPEILDVIPFSQYTNELGIFNLEINLDPYPLEGLCFDMVQTELEQLLDKGERYAIESNGRFLLTGVLPTLQKKNLDFAYITPQPRYKLLSETLLRIRGNDFQVYLQGVDEINSTLDSVLYEACNTSFQLHLQVRPQSFVEQYNWSQMIAGPMMSACVNSPILFGRELWAETRIALFKQSLDTRTFSNHIRTQMPRVSFGKDWIKNSFSDIYKDQVSRFPVLLQKKGVPSSSEIFERGEVPKLPYLLLHSGTTYSWNRPCYGSGGKKPHIRIECRYLPAGPSVPDEMANFAFWVGLMKAMPESAKKLPDTVDFKMARGNFIKAARYGLETVHDWYGEKIPAQLLILDKLMPMAEQGLKKSGVNSGSIERYLNIIQNRVESYQTGASWQIRNFRRLRERYSKIQAAQVLTEYMVHHRNDAVHLWKDISVAKYHKVTDMNKSVMSCLSGDLITLKDDVPIALARKIMHWKGINHIIVENRNNQLNGVLSSADLPDHTDIEKNGNPISSIMSRNVISISIDETPERAWQIMRQNKVRCLPVLEGKELVGIVTSNDLMRCDIVNHNDATQ